MRHHVVAWAYARPRRILQCLYWPSLCSRRQHVGKEGINHAELFRFMCILSTPAPDERFADRVSGSSAEVPVACPGEPSKLRLILSLRADQPRAHQLTGYMP